MRPVKQVVLDLIQCPNGALAIWLASSLVILVGMTAFAVDMARYYSAQSQLQRLTSKAAEILLLNASILPEASQVELATAYLQATLQSEGSASANPLSLQSVSVDISNLDGAGTVQITATATLSPGLLQLIQMEDGLTLRVDVTAILRPTPLEIALIMDRKSADKLDLFKSGGQYLTRQFEKLQTYGTPIRMGVIPGATSQVNVGTHTEWLAQGQWPAEMLPPNVPGIAGWSGDLVDQTWCVVRRDGQAGVDGATPAMAPFETSLMIDQSVDESRGVTFSIRFDEDCPQTPIYALSKDWNGLRAYMEDSRQTIEFAPDRGLIWAQRLLDRDWQNAWGITPLIEGEVRTVVVLFAASSLENNEAEPGNLTAVCEQLKQSGYTLNIIDFSGADGNAAYFGNCASEMSFAKVSSEAEFEKTLAAFIQTLLRPQIIEVK